MFAFGGDICLSLVTFASSFGLAFTHVLTLVSRSFTFPLRCSGIREISPSSLRWRREALAFMRCSGSSCPRLLSEKTRQGSARIACPDFEICDDPRMLCWDVPLCRKVAGVLRQQVNEIGSLIVPCVDIC
jgi:hypothetical protein